MWQVTHQLYMESGFSHTQRNNYLFDIALLTILESEKFKSGGFFPYILTMTFQCSLVLDDAWNSDQHFPKRACIYWTCYGLSAHHYTVLPAACFILLALKNKWNAPSFWPKMTTGRNLLHNGCFEHSFSRCKLQNLLKNPCLLFEMSCYWYSKDPDLQVPQVRNRAGQS